MPDKTITCQNCQAIFVYSEYEQKIDQARGTAEPTYCTICKAIKSSEAKHPPKPKTS